MPTPNTRECNDPVLPRGLLFVVALVFCGGVGVVNVAAVALTLGPHGAAMGVEASFGIEDSSAGSTNAALVARIDDIGYPYLTVLGPPVALFGAPLLLRLGGLRVIALGFARFAGAGLVQACLWSCRTVAIGIWLRFCSVSGCVLGFVGIGVSFAVLLRCRRFRRAFFARAAVANLLDDVRSAVGAAPRAAGEWVVQHHAERGRQRRRSDCKRFGSHTVLRRR